LKNHSHQALGALSISPASGALGAIIEGLDISKLNSAQVAAIRPLVDEYSVLVFPDQKLTPEEQIAFTAHFGPVEQHPLYRSAILDGYPEILVLEHKNHEWVNGRNDVWHSDVTFSEEPPLGSVLYCRAITEGLGDTLFCSMRRAYDALSPGMQQMLRQLSAEHSSARMVVRNNSESYNVPIDEVPPPVNHPVVRTNRATGKQNLFVNPIYTIRFAGMTEKESDPLLNYLYEQATRPDNIYRHRWKVNDVVMFDNRCAMHYVVLDYGPEMHRLMHRTTAAGERPV
jgi:taurine dioxygenase